MACSGNTQSVASVSLQRSVDKGAQVIFGATPSPVSLSVINQAVAAGVMLFSPTNTAVKLSDPAITRGLYFRTALPDRQMQAALLTVNPSLANFAFGPETHDAVVITALAAETAVSVARSRLSNR